MACGTDGGRVGMMRPVKENLRIYLHRTPTFGSGRELEEVHFTNRYVLAAMAVCWLVLTIWTVRRLGSISRASDDVVYRFGVRYFGVSTWIAATAIGTYAAMQANPTDPGHQM
jgi:hypothetical protein